MGMYEVLGYRKKRSNDRKARCKYTQVNIPPPRPLFFVVAFFVAPQRSMPLCMKQLHTALNREHKLKHWGRLQYGLFLKGAGLSVDDAMAFWQVRRPAGRRALVFCILVWCRVQV